MRPSRQADLAFASRSRDMMDRSRRAAFFSSRLPHDLQRTSNSLTSKASTATFVRTHRCRQLCDLDGRVILRQGRASTGTFVRTYHCRQLCDRNQLDGPGRLGSISRVMRATMLRPVPRDAAACDRNRAVSLRLVTAGGSNIGCNMYSMSHKQKNKNMMCKVFNEEKDK